jgi:UDP-2,3-diacylglucosamine hydrolase
MKHLQPFWILNLSTMNLLIISDLHLSPTSEQRTNQFLQFLEAAWKNKDEVLIVGDLFDLWFGWQDLTMEFQKPVLSRMKELFSLGLKIDYAEGNRDFGIHQQQGLLFRRVVSRAWEAVWDGRRIHAEHGDLINRSDRPYRIWRRISKNKLAYFFLEHLPSIATLRLGLQLEKNMRKTNRKNKLYYPEHAAQDFLLEMGEAGMDLVVVGHFHLEKTVQLRAANRDVLFYNLPGWEQGFRYLVIPSGKGLPYFTDWGKQNGNSATA